MVKKTPATPVIRLRGVRHNNLKNFDLDLPQNRLIVVTGLSGSGKSSLAFDTLFAEGQRRYIETFSPYARQFFDRMDKPQVDSIEGIPPAIAIEQRNGVKTTRSTVGTMTEICDYMKLLWPHVAQLHCRHCGQPVRKDSPRHIWETIQRMGESLNSGAPGGQQDNSRGQTSGTNAALGINTPITSSPSPPAAGGDGRGEEGFRTGFMRDHHLQSDDGVLHDALIVGSTKAATNNNTGRSSPHFALRTPHSAFEILVTFNVPISENLSLDESLALISKQGYQRLLLENEILRLEEAIPRLRKLKPPFLTIVQDRIKLAKENRARFIEACEQAYHFGKGKLAIRALEDAPANTFLFSNRLHCAECDIEYREPSSALFSFNHPVGACPACRGFGRIITIDYDLALPDRSKTLAEGVVRPWQSGQSAECQDDLKKFCRLRRVPMDVPFQDLPQKWRDWVINGDSGYGKDSKHQWPRAWYGIKGYFRWLESKAYKMHVRVLLSRYRSYQPCPDCHGARFQPETLLYKVQSSKFKVQSPDSRDSAPRTPHSEFSLTLADFYRLPIRDALAFIGELAARHNLKSNDPVGLALNEVRSRLGYLNDVGLGYLTLDRPTRTLSGGETERVSLTTCLGTRLVNTLFVLDEPSVGLHPRDTDRLVRVLEQLRNAGNTVVVVEHEASVMRAADQIIDLGPGHGASGGDVVFQGSYAEILDSPDSLTGQYLGGRKQIEIPERRRVGQVQGSRFKVQSSGNGKALSESKVIPNSALRTPHSALNTHSALQLSHATLHNLQDLTVEIPLGRFVCLTGVSGSGKTTLAREILFPLLSSKFKIQNPKPEDTNDAEDSGDDESAADSESAAGNSLALEGWESLGRVVLVDQSILAKTPRSNPAVYIGAFDDLRELFAQCDLARQRGLNASAFSFNSSQGQCERCRGAGFEKIEMQFLSDVFIRCPECNGRRYRPHILEIKISPSTHWPPEPHHPKGVTAISPGLRGTSYPGNKREKIPPPLLPRREERAGERRVSMREVHGEGEGSVKPASAPTSPKDSSPTLWSIADLLDATVDEAIEFLSSFGDSRHAQRAATSLKLLQEVGLGYLRLGQPINTLSGGESQRLKLVRHLAEAAQSGPRTSIPGIRSTLFLFDEPTTGLHFDDVRVLLKVFQRLVDAGHSVLIIEHNLDVIKSADWVIDLGPDAGDQGGQIVAEGTPEQIAECAASHTGQALKAVLSQSQFEVSV